MNEQKIRTLAAEVAEFTVSKVVDAGLTAAEVSRAMGEALAIVTAKPFLQMIKDAGALPLLLDEDEEEEEEEELKAIYSEEEMEFMRQRLSSSYPLETVIQIAKGDLKVPGWLRKEILERRG